MLSDLPGVWHKQSDLFKCGNDLPPDSTFSIFALKKIFIFWYHLNCVLGRMGDR